MSHQQLPRRILNGDRLAAEELIKRNKEMSYDLNPKPPFSKESLFEHIVEKNLLDIAIMFVNAVAYLNTVDKFESTPLHVAVSMNKKSFVMPLLEKNVNISVKNKDEKTAGQLAAESGHCDIAALLHPIPLSPAFLLSPKFPIFFKSRHTIENNEINSSFSGFKP